MMIWSTLQDDHPALGGSLHHVRLKLVQLENALGVVNICGGPLKNPGLLGQANKSLNFF